MMAKGIVLFNNIIGSKGDIFNIKSDLFDCEFNRYILFLYFINLNIFGSSYFKQFIVRRVKYKRKGFIDLRLPFFFGRIRYYKDYDIIHII